MRLGACVLAVAVMVAVPARADWDLQVEDGNRVSLPANEMDTLLSQREWYRDVAQTSTASAASWRELADSRAEEIAALKRANERLAEVAEPKWYESPILWVVVGAIVGGGLVGMGAFASSH